MREQNTTTGQITSEFDLAMPVAELTELENGLQVVTLDTGVQRGDVAIVQLRILAGSALDDELPGLAKFTGAMVSRGSAGRSLEIIAEELDGMGASIGIGVGGQSTNGSMKSLREDADRTLEYLKNALLQPDFPLGQVEIVRNQMLSGLRQAKNSTRAAASRLLRKTIYPAGHPFHQRSIGTEESLAAIDREILQTFHEKAYKPGNGIVSVAGGLSHQQAVELVSKHFGDWTGNPPVVEIHEVDQLESSLRVDQTLPGKSQADLMMGQPSIKRDHPAFYALSIANLVLGRFGLFGRLGESVRERQGMAYYAYSNLDAGKHLGLWTVSAGVATQNVDRAIDSILVEVEKFQEEGATDQEFSDAAGSILGSLPLSLETSSSMASVATDLVYNELGLDFLQRFRSIISAVTIEDVQAAARDHLHPTTLVTAVVSPVSDA